ncbi:MAG: SRPBCC family protein [Rubrobacter sp.]|nr:SRPBCC family protein [Rubrobacter sp.]
MTNEYEQTLTIYSPADEVFAWLADVGNLPHYLPPVKDSWIEGPSTPGTPGDRIGIKVEIPGRYETESTGYFHADTVTRRMEWGAEFGRDYSGWLTVNESGEGESEVTAHLSFGPRSVEGEVQESSPEEQDSMDKGISSTLESIRRQIEEGSGKVRPPSAEA